MNAVTNNILLVYVRPKSPEREDEFNTWFNNYHLQQVLRVPGFVAATRYKVSHQQMEWMPPMRDHPQWPYGQDSYLNVYELDPSCDARGVFETLRATEAQRATRDPENDPVEWGQQWLFEPFTQRETSAWLKPPKPANPGPFHLWIVPSTPLSVEVEEENNRWYTTQVNLRYPGFESVARYKLAAGQGTIDSRAPEPQGEWPFGRHSHLAVWEIDDLLQAIHYRRRAQETGTAMPRYSWIPPVNQLRRADDHVIYEPVTNRVTPIFIRPRE